MKNTTYHTTVKYVDGFTIQITETKVQDVVGNAKGAIKTTYTTAVLLPSSLVVYISPSTKTVEEAEAKASNFINNYDVFIFDSEFKIYSGSLHKTKTYYHINDDLEMVQI